MSKHYFFCGIAGHGMSSLAIILANRGYTISGSDRSFDNGENTEKRKFFDQMGFTIYPQDSSGVTQKIDQFVTSTAVEAHIPDVKAAMDLNIPIQKRSDLLAELIENATGFTVSGTSGKSTVTGMIATIFDECELNPTVMNGAVMVNFANRENTLGNTVNGSEKIFVTEACESDGSLVQYKPSYSVINNITLDHMPIEELRDVFKTHIKNIKRALVINMDDEECRQLELHPNTVTFAFDHDADIQGSNPTPVQDGIQFDVTYLGTTYPVHLKVPGKHNAQNALAALGMALAYGIPLSTSIPALEQFKGIRSRLETVATTANGITVIDDFGHNPDKITASIETLKQSKGRLIIMFQPHGFGPTKLMRQGYVDVFSKYLGDHDVLLMPEIYYAGGTASKEISSKDLTDAIQANGKTALFFENKQQVEDWIMQNAMTGDRVVIMGARDDGLRIMAHNLPTRLSKAA